VAEVATSKQCHTAHIKVAGSICYEKYSYILKNVNIRKKCHELGEIPTSSLFFAFS